MAVNNMDFVAVFGHALTPLTFADRHSGLSALRIVCSDSHMACIEIKSSGEDFGFATRYCTHVCRTILTKE